MYLLCVLLLIVVGKETKDVSRDFYPWKYAINCLRRKKKKIIMNNDMPSFFILLSF